MNENENGHGGRLYLTQEREDGTALMRYLGRGASSVVIPDSVDGKPVVEIGPCCFCRHSEIERISFPQTLKTIREDAFTACGNLREAVIPDGVEEIGSYAFRDCTGLKRVVLPSGLRRLRTGVFAFCYFSDDVEIVFKEGLETIEPCVFSSGGINLFFTVVLPSSVREVDEDAFEPGVRVLRSAPGDGKKE